MTTDRAVVLLMTHFLDDRIVGQYRRLRAELSPDMDVVVLYNRSDDPRPCYQPPPDLRLFAFGAEHIRGLGYPKKGRRLNARDVELFVVHFHRRHPHYTHYWVLEYDVAFTGPWNVLTEAFAANDADLLATTICRHRVNPGWENWSTVKGPMGRPSTASLVRAFLPIYRISRRALVALNEAYSAGWHGHYEATVPTVLSLAGYRLEDFGGDGEFVAQGNTNRFYTNTPAVNSLAPGSFVFRPVRHAPGSESNMLWHPVKPQALAEGWATGRRRLLSRWASEWAREGKLRLTRLLVR